MTTAVTLGSAAHREPELRHAVHTAGPGCACRRLADAGWTIDEITVTAPAKTL